MNKYVERKRKNEQKALELWNTTRRSMADRIDREFAHQLDGGNRNPHEWVVDPGGTIEALAARAKVVKKMHKDRKNKEEVCSVCVVDYDFGQYFGLDVTN